VRYRLDCPDSNSLGILSDFFLFYYSDMISSGLKHPAMACFYSFFQVFLVSLRYLLGLLVAAF
jgi:hypothetical protein